MGTSRYVALLRGINVGGKNPVPMADLRAALDQNGFDAVRTYIQSGNVVFASNALASTLEGALEAVLAHRFHVPIPVVVRSHRQLRAIVSKAPDGFGADPDRYHSDVAFLKGSLTPRRVMQLVEPRDGVDRAWPGTGVVYFQRLSAKRAQSRMSRITSIPEYQQMTIRNWATTTKLLTLLDEA